MSMSFLLAHMGIIVTESAFVKLNYNKLIHGLTELWTDPSTYAFFFNSLSAVFYSTVWWVRFL